MEKGFTLIELLITTAILAVLAVVGSVSLFGYYSRQNLELTADEIIAFARDAQNRSFSQQDGNGDGEGDQWGLRFTNATATQDYIELFSGPTYATGTISSAYSLRVSTQFTDPSQGNSKDVVFSKITGYPDASSTIKIASISNSSVSTTISIDGKGIISSF